MSNAFTSWIQSRLHLCGLTLIKNSHPGTRYLHLLPVNALNYALHRAFDILDNVRFLQIGAHDGIRNDPLHPFLEHWHWKGARVEPHPDFYAALQQQNLAGVELIQAAITKEDGNLNLYSINPAHPGLPKWSAGLATIEREQILQSCRFLDLPESVIQTTQVHGLTWASLLDRLRYPKIDLLCLDVEGMDIPLLSQWNFEHLRPRLIFFEHGRAVSKEKWDLYELLTHHGYEIATEGVDTAAFLPKEKDK